MIWSYAAAPWPMAREPARARRMSRSRTAKSRGAAKLQQGRAEEVAHMGVLTAEARRAGAIGFSTSPTLNHRTVKGDPKPSLRASEAELLGIALGMKDAGRGVIEFISDFNTPSP